MDVLGSFCRIFNTATAGVRRIRSARDLWQERGHWQPEKREIQV